jgi:hypothetical protein
MNIEIESKRGLACFDYDHYEDELLVYIGDDEESFDWYNKAMREDKFPHSFEDYVEANGGRETFYDDTDSNYEHTTIEVELPWAEFTETYKARELFETYCTKILAYHSLVK